MDALRRFIADATALLAATDAEAAQCEAVRDEGTGAGYPLSELKQTVRHASELLEAFQQQRRRREAGELHSGSPHANANSSVEDEEHYRATVAAVMEKMSPALPSADSITIVYAPCAGVSSGTDGSPHCGGDAAVDAASMAMAAELLRDADVRECYASLAASLGEWLEGPCAATCPPADAARYASQREKAVAMAELFASAECGAFLSAAAGADASAPVVLAFSVLMAELTALGEAPPGVAM